MVALFHNSLFNGDISQWDVSKVGFSQRMFENCPIRDEYRPLIMREDELGI